MTIEKIRIEIREERTGNRYDVLISTDDLIKSLRDAKSTEYLWLYISGYVKGMKWEE